MRQIREILRLVWSCGQSRKNTAIACGVGKTTVTDTVARATAAGLKWPLPTLDDEALDSWGQTVGVRLDILTFAGQLGSG